MPAAKTAPPPKSVAMPVALVTVVVAGLAVGAHVPAFPLLWAGLIFATEMTSVRSRRSVCAGCGRQRLRCGHADWSHSDHTCCHLATARASSGFQNGGRSQAQGRRHGERQGARRHVSRSTRT